ncbi:FAD-binding oxidoreductase [Streptomyces olivoreticuli]|uniref:FAD-binding oxidoreductase n=1 Tax=Streptomyces olivoreticuli TaxID=68246 RepID=UPI000E21C210|nr:FAD-binding oxidoreductase [Streptomyces olivoreticuli]
MTSLSRRRLFAGAAALGTAAAAPQLLGAAPAGAAPRSAAPTAAAGTFPVSTVKPGDRRYATLSRGNNHRFVGAPEYVRLVGSTADVVQAVQEAVDSGKRVAVRSGGHCYEGFVDDPAVQVIIDLSEMNEISFDAKRGAFAVEGGAMLGEVYERLYKGWGVTVPGGNCPTVAAGGHVAGGGYGSLSRQHGLVVDHLHAVEVVVVDSAGKARAVVATNAKSDPNRDLWWAHTGAGGGNFGVVTKYWFRSPGATGTDPAKLLPQPPSEVWISNVVWPWGKLDEQSFSRLVQNFGAWHERNSAPDSPYRALFSQLKLIHPDNGVVILSTQIDAGAEDAEKLLDAYHAAIAEGVGVPHTVTERHKLPWLQATRWAGFTGPDPTQRFKGKPAYFRKNFSADQARTMYRQLTRDDYHASGAFMTLAGIGGQGNAVAPTATAVAQRDSVVKFQCGVLWTDANEDDKHLTWVRGLYKELFSATGGVPVPNEQTDGLFINYADVDARDPNLNTSGVSWSALYFKGNYPKLQQVKAAWDPKNLFRHGLSIEPSR